MHLLPLLSPAESLPSDRDTDSSTANPGDMLVQTGVSAMLAGRFCLSQTPCKPSTFELKGLRERILYIEQWLQRHPEAGSSRPSWPKASQQPRQERCYCKSVERLITYRISQVKAPEPLPCEERIIKKIRTFTVAPRPESDIDCLVFAIDARQRNIEEAK